MKVPFAAAVAARIARAAVPAVTALALSPAAAVAATPADDPLYTLVFEDGFDGTAVDTTRWNYRADISKNPSGTAAMSWQRPDNVSVGGGNMQIALVQSPDPTKAPFSGGGLISKRKFRYGYYETRMKINQGGGWHSAFWMMDWDAVNQKPTPTRATEIDAFEIDSGSPKNMRENLITWKPGTNQYGPVSYSSGVYGTGMDLSAGFHTYGMEWTESGIRYYVDGVVQASYVVNGVRSGLQQPYTPVQWNHDLLSIWLTTIAYGNGTPVVDPSGGNVTTWDYVRYWQRDYYVDNSSASDATGGPAGGPDGTYAETAGTWLLSGLDGWTKGNPSRYAACGVAGATATWTPDIQAAGTYEIFAYDIVNANSDTNARYDVLGVGPAAATFVNGTTGQSGWVSLGTYALAAGTGASVQLTSSGSGCARADAVKFVRVS
jgi:beta-glucanase (GH16 family)